MRKSHSKVLPLALLGLSVSLLCWLPAHAQGTSTALTGMVNVKEFGAKGNGVTDDTAALKAAIAEQQLLMPGGGELYFPYGTCDTLKLQSVCDVRGVGNPQIVMTDPKKDIMSASAAWRMTFTGLTFVDGRRQLALVNPNLDTGAIYIENCKFMRSEEQAIETSLRSTNVFIEKCHFLQCEQALTTTTDMVTMRDSWITSKMGMTDKAQIEARGDMMLLENLCLVPLVSGVRQRWIDNYSAWFLTCRSVRFGGEFGGFTPIYNFAKAIYVASGPSILVEDCTIGANGSYNANCAVYCEEVPNKIEVRSCGLVGCKPIILSKNVDLRTCFTGIPRNTLSFTATGNLGSYAEAIPPCCETPSVRQGNSQACQTRSPRRPWRKTLRR